MKGFFKKNADKIKNESLDEKFSEEDLRDILISENRLKNGKFTPFK